MKKYLALFLSLILLALCISACGSSTVEDTADIDVILDGINANSSLEEHETLSTVYLNSSRQGAITKAANPVIGIKFDNIESIYDISKTSSNFKVAPLDGSVEAFYVMCDSPDEVLLGDFEYGFATALSTKWEDLLHIYDFEKNVVYKVVTPRNTNKIKKVGDSKYAVQYISDEGENKSISFSTSDKYAYDLFASNKDVIMIVDGGSEYDVARELAQESEGATTTTIIEESLTSTIEASSDDELVLVAAEKDKVSVRNRDVSETAAEEYRSQESADGETAEQTTTVAPDMIQDTGVIEYIEEPEQTAEETLSNEEVQTDEISSDEQSKTENAENTSEAGEDSEEEIETTVIADRNAVNESETEQAAYTEAAMAAENVSKEEQTEKTVSRHQDIPGGRIISAPVIAQFPYYPTGCESVSATMALQYSGVNVSVDDFINLYLDKDNTFYFQDGIKYGPSPYEFFIGNPYDSSGFGCMSNVIFKALLKIYGDDRTKVVNASGIAMNELCNDYINQDLPVIVWVNIGMADAFDSNTWNLADGSEFVWQGGEHCMLLVGYDAYNYYFNDPYTGKCISYGRDVSEKCYLQQGMQAIVIMN